MKYIVSILFFSVCLFDAGAQDIGSIGKQKPFTLSGNIGASANFYHSNEPVATRPPFAWNLYGNLTPAIYGIALPLSFTVNQYGNSYSQPFAQFGLSPTYKWAKLHLGYRNLPFSPVTFDGQSFRGVGLELTPKMFRFAAFYGKLNRKVNEDTTNGRFAPPQFSRTGYGIKAGVGNSANYWDFIYLHAKDDSGSATVINKSNYRPQENTVIGSSFKISVARKIIFATDVAISGLTQDIGVAKNTSDSGMTALQKLMKGFVVSNSSTVANWAGQSTLQFLLKGYTSTLGYRRVQPGFKSLGTPYMLDDVELLNWLNNISVSNGKLNISAGVASQHNNLNHQLSSMLKTYTGNLNINALLTPYFNVNFNYSGYQLQQKDGKQTLNDSARLNQQIHQLSFSPSYTTINSVHSGTISGSINYMLLNDNNPVTQPFTNSNNISGSLNYTIGFIKKASSVTVSGLYSRYTQDTNYYSTYGATIGGGAQVLKDKQLGLQGSAGYLFNKSSHGNARNNLTFSLNVNYHIRHHSLNAFANYIYTPYNPINNIIYKNVPQAVATKNMAGGIAYNYSF